MTAAQTASYPKRLIEVDLPIRRISVHARREKSIRHGHISTLHIWWARRPLAACRAVMCAALWLDPADADCPDSFIKAATQAMREWGRSNLKLCSEETISRFIAAAKDPGKYDDREQLRVALFDFIADFADWNNSTVREYLDTAGFLTKAAHEALGGESGTRPLVVDPFAGGGSIPLEALRVGAEAYATDLNPVPVLLNKVLLEYIPKYGASLSEQVRKWGSWVDREARKEIATFYPLDTDGATPVAYLWARTVLSEAPSEDAVPIEIPLLRSMWLAKKGKGKNRALRWQRDAEGQVQTEIATVTYANGKALTVRRPLLEVFEPTSSGDVESGPSSGGAATCPVSGYTNSVESVRLQLIPRKGGASDARLVCVVTARHDATGRKYRLPNQQDILATQESANAALAIQTTYIQGIPAVPDGKLNHLRGFFNVVLYGITTWGDIFSPRQQVTLTTLSRLVCEAGERVRKEVDPGLAEAVQSCLALTVSRHADINASLGMWHNTRELITHVFGRQALPMVWDFAEANPFSGASGAYLGGVDWVSRVLEQPIASQGYSQQASATSHPLPDDSADVVFTDPPYYAAIPYADLSDFFFSWLRRMLFTVHGNLFGPELSPKDDECVSLAHRAAMYRHKDSAWFESKMTDACREMRRINKPNGIGVFVFANKETSGWEAMLSALIQSGWIVTASWPIDTEMGNRLRARNSAALASSIHLVGRPRQSGGGSLRNDIVGDWRDVLQELPRRIHEWMPRLAEEGVVGADAIFACLGPALEVYSRYPRVERASGEVVTLKEYLEHVWAAVSKEALSMIFAGANTEGFEPDARLTAMWLWTLAAPAGDGHDSDVEEKGDEEDDESGSKRVKAGGFVLEFDAARKIAQGLGASLESLGNLVELCGDKARLLPVSERTRYLFGKEQADAPSAKKKKKPQLDMFAELTQGNDSEATWGEKAVSKPGQTTLDRIHQSMIMFAAGRGEALKRFLVDDGAGRDQKFWRLAQALSALYPPTTDEKRWVDGVLARKKGLGL